MPQNFDAAKPASGVTLFSQLYQVLRDHFAALRSAFSGAGFPANAVAGQACFRTDRGAYGQLYRYSGNAALGEGGWLTEESYLAEVRGARGTAASVAARLAVALNEDGTLKTDPPAGGWWTAEGDAVAYLSATQFTVAGDKRAIYALRRAVRFDGTDAGWVGAASYAAGPNLTTVTAEGVAVPAGLAAVEYGQPVASAPMAELQAHTALDYAVAAGVTGVSVDASAAERTVTLPSISGLPKGFSITVTKTDASGNHVVVVPDGADQLMNEALASVELTARGEMMVFRVFYNGAGARWAVSATGGAGTTGALMNVLTWAGNGAGPRNINGAGFQPDVCTVWKQGDSNSVVFKSAEDGVYTKVAGGGYGTNRVIAFLADGIQIGSDGDVNKAGVNYVAVVWRKS